MASSMTLTRQASVKQFELKFSISTDLFFERACLSKVYFEYDRGAVVCNLVPDQFYLFEFGRLGHQVVYSRYTLVGDVCLLKFTCSREVCEVAAGLQSLVTFDVCELF